MTSLSIGVVAAGLALILATTEVGQTGEATLGAAAAQSGRYFGAALDPDALDDRSYREVAATQLTSVTPENAMKWGPVEPLRGEYDWNRADALVAFAKAHGQKVRGHTLVWHSQLPLWLINGAFTSDELKGLMVAHVAAEVGRYRGAVYAWDVRAVCRRRELAQVDLVRRDGLRLCRNRAQGRPRRGPRGQALYQRLQCRDGRAEDAGSL